MTLWMLTAREIWRRPGRVTLTLLSIVIGVAAVVAVSVAASTTRQVYARMYEALTGRAGLEVTSEDGESFDESLVPVLEKVPGVREAVPTTRQFTVLYHQGKRLRLLAMGIEPGRDAAVRDYELERGDFLEREDGALLEAGFARGAGIGIGDTVRLLTRRGVQEVAIVGLLSPRGVAGLLQGGTLFLPLKTSQLLFRKGQNVDNVSLVLADSAEESVVSAEVARRLPAGLSVRAPATRTRAAKSTNVQVEQGLTFACAVTVVMAVFIILNTFLMNLGERRRQLAVLRAIGATRRQVTMMLLREALLMGVAGTVLGTLAGLGGAGLLLRAMAQLTASPPPAIQLTWAPFLWAVTLGPGVALLGAYVPARQAGRVSPLEGIRAASPSEGEGVSRSMTLAGVALSVLGGLLFGACIGGWLPIVVSVPAGIVFLVSFVLVLPALLRPLAYAVAAVLHPLLGTTWFLAHRQILRRRTRTGLTVGVLYIAVAMGIGLGTTIINNVQDVRNWYRRTMVGDFFVRAAFPDPATGLAVEMDASLGKEIRGIPGVIQMDTIRFLEADVADNPVIIVAREFADPDYLPLDLAEGDAGDVRARLLRGEVVVGTVLAQKAGVEVGGEIVVQTKGGPHRMTVAGTTVEYTAGGLVLYVQRAVAERLFHVEGIDAFLIRAAPEALGDVEGRLSVLCNDRGLMVHSFAELSRMLDTFMTGVVRCLWGLLVLGFVVAGFGIANTLTMNVLEQTREIALLRVVALTRRQIRTMILAQAGVIGLIGLATGVFAGVETAYLMSLCMMPLLGYPVTFALHPVLLAGSFGIGLMIVLVAAALPARRAARLNLLVALQYE